jgi:tryptophan-rich sensory protein
MKTIEIVKLLLAIIICQAAGFAGSVFTTPSIATWYVTLQKPSFAPPNWIFAPVWITLFTLMGISLYLVWSKGLEKKKVKIAISIFAAQLVLNIIWSILFFGLHSPAYAFAEIIILWIAIALTIFKFSKISRNATLVLLPYIIWVSIAAYLNYSIWILNVMII